MLLMTRPILVDLSHAVEGEGSQYPGLPAPLISSYRSRQETAANYAPGVSFLLSRVEMVTNVGRRWCMNRCKRAR